MTPKYLLIAMEQCTRVVLCGVLFIACAHGQALAQKSSPRQTKPAAQLPLRQQVEDASASGAANLALDLANRQPGLFTPLEYARLEQAAIAQRLRWSKAEMWELSGPERFRTLDSALIDGQGLLLRLPDTPEYASVRHALVGDLVFGLSTRGRMDEAIGYYESLAASGAPVYPYVLVAAADAYAYNEELDKAIACYERALSEAGPADIDRPAARESLFYVYLDRARYEDAQAMLDVLDKESPMYVDRAPLPETPNDDYVRAKKLRAQYMLYTGDTLDGIMALDALRHDAPFSSSLSNAAAESRVGNARPRKARDEFEAALLERPDDIGAFIGLGRVSLALRDYPEAERITQTLSERFPENSAVRNLQRDYDVYQSPLLTVDAGGDRSNASGDTAIANREWSIDSKLYTAPIDYNYRLFFHQFTGQADLDDGRKSRVRNGAGVDYRRGDIDGSLEIHQSTGPSGRTGVTGSVGYEPADGWRVEGQLTSDANDLPWKAYKEGVHGWGGTVSVRRQPDELGYVDLAYGAQHYSDSNVRQQVGVTWFRHLAQTPRHGLSAWASAAYSKNTRTNVSYFSPSHDLTGQVTAMYEWRPWRNGQYGFRQRVYGTAGAYKQGGFDTSGLWEVRLEQAWDLPRRASILYGIGYGRRSYDGDPENRALIYLSLNLPF